MKNVVIDLSLCKRCGICVRFCPVGVFVGETDGTPVVEHPEKCTGCNLCALRCPDFAITVEAQA